MPRVLILTGPAGAGCTSVGRAVERAEGLRLLDLAQHVADELGTSPDLALVEVPETEYRRVEAAAALQLLEEVAAAGGVVALGSGCLSDPRVRERLVALQAGGAMVVALTCATRVLATRNGLDAPRSVALGTVHHQFVQMLHQREVLCRELSDVVVDTTATTPEQAAEQAIQATGTDL